VAGDVYKMKRKAEIEVDIDSITDMMKESNMFDGDDEMAMLLEGSDCKWDNAMCYKILDKAVSRYNRYVRNINFGNYSYIEEQINVFLHKYEGNTKPWTFQAMKAMVEIDGEILQIIEMEEVVSKVESSYIDDNVNHNRKRMKREQA